MAVKISLQIISNSANGESDTMNVGYVNPDLLEEDDRGASKIDACARAIIALSTNSYSDTLLVTTDSVNEMLA